MFCTKCGNQVEDGSLFCTYCGAKMIQPQSINTAPAQTSQYNEPAQASQYNESVQTSQYTETAQTSQYEAPAQASQYNESVQASQYNEPAQTSQYDAPAQTSQYAEPGYTEDSYNETSVEISDDNETEARSGMSTKMLVGIICGSVALLALIITLVAVLLKKDSGVDITDEDVVTTEAATEEAEVTTEAATAATTTEEVTTEEKIPEVDEAVLLAADEAYLRMMADKKGSIEKYTWQHGINDPATRPIALKDINRDGIPEFIFMQVEDQFFADLYIYGFKDNKPVELYYEKGLDAEVAGGTNFYVSTLKGTDEVFIYRAITDDMIDEAFYELKPDAKGYYQKGTEYTSYNGPGENDTDRKIILKKDGKEISNDEFSEYVNQKQDAIDSFLMFSDGEDIENLVSEKNDLSMNIDEAKDVLADGLDIDVEALFTVTLPIDGSVELSFLSGVGAWSTGMTLYPDGSFEGLYHDSDMGDIGEGYPNGTIYYSDFSGKFKNITKVDNNTYKMELDYYNTKQTVGTDELYEEIHYIYTEPYGIDGGTVFYFYLPDKSMYELTDDFLGWSYGLEGNSTLGCYGLYNQDMGEGFFSY